jgi:hypothetical protein
MCGGRIAAATKETGMTYLGSGDPARRRTDYYPEWLDNLADDVTLEGSVLNGVVTGAEAVRTLLAYARTLYDYQEFNFAGPYGNNGFLEDYTAQVHGERIGTVVTVSRDAAGQTKHIVVNHRPLDSLLLFSRLMARNFAGTPYGELYARADH